MKKVIYIALALIGGGAVSCEDHLNTSSPSQFTDDVVFSTVAYTNYAVNGIYNMVANAEVYGQKLSLNFSTNNDIEHVGADINSYSQDSYRGNSNYLGRVDNGDFKKAWDALYKLIERSNMCIKGIETSPLYDGSNSDDDKKMKAYLGEALTLRALAYFELVRHWGDVPFKTDPTEADLSNVYLPATNRDTIYDHILSDLVVADEIVPWVGAEGYTSAERVTKGFVKGLIARVALHRGGYSIRNKEGFPMERPDNYLEYYQLANKYAKELYESDVHKLNPSYANIWKVLNKLELDGTYKENLFEVAFGFLQAGEMGYSVGVRFYQNPKYGYGNNTNIVNTNAYYFYSFDSTDVRRDVTVAYYQYSNSDKETKEIMKSSPLDWNIGKWDQRWMSDQFLEANKNANGKVGYGINWVVMRYSDVLLMLAETENELNNGPTDLAKEALKLVRKRSIPLQYHSSKVDSYVDGLGSKEAFFDAIVNERAWEFGGEAVRKFDLVRWNLIIQKIELWRSTMKNMLNGTYPVAIFDKTYNSLPPSLFYKYEENNEILDRTAFNWYEDKGTADIEGYTRLAWLSGASESNKLTYTNLLDAFSSGLTLNAGGVYNRYIFPIPYTAVSESQGLLSNSYGY